MIRLLNGGAQIVMKQDESAIGKVLNGIIETNIWW